MRIIAGDWRGRKLLRPSEAITRPTTDRVREALFSIITSQIKSFQNTYILDAFAGSGAFGLEALSRGAECILFAEKSPSARHILMQNIDSLQCSQKCTIIHDIFKIPTTQKAFTVIFMDPPYGEQLEFKAIPLLVEHGYINDSTLIIIETHSDAIPETLSPLNQLMSKKYGKCALSFWKQKI